MNQVQEIEGCPECGGAPMPLGSLGGYFHFRCRQCGWTFSALLESEEGE